MLHLQDIADQIDQLARCPASETAPAWRDLQRQIDTLCHHLKQAPGPEAQAALPILAEIITRLDQVIGEMETDTPQG